MLFDLMLGQKIPRRSSHDSLFFSKNYVKASDLNLVFNAFFSNKSKLAKILHMFAKKAQTTINVLVIPGCGRCSRETYF